MNRPLVFGGVAVLVAAAAVGFLVADQTEPLEERAAESAAATADAPAAVTPTPETAPAETPAVAAVEPEPAAPEAAVDEVIEAAEDAIAAADDAVAEATEEAVDEAGDAVRRLRDGAADAVEEATDEAVAAVEEAVEDVPAVAEQAAEAATEQAEALAATVPEVAEQAAEAVTEQAEDLVAAVPEVAEQAAEAVTEQAEDLVAAVPEVAEPADAQVAAVPEVAEQAAEAVTEQAEGLVAVPDVNEPAAEAVAEPADAQVAAVPEVAEPVEDAAAEAVAETPARRVVESVGEVVEQAAEAVADTARDLAETAQRGLDELAAATAPETPEPAEVAPAPDSGLTIAAPEVPDLTPNTGEIAAAPAGEADAVPQVAALPTPEESSVAPEEPVAPKVVARPPEEMPVESDDEAVTPTFDVVRVDPSGGVVIAGQAGPLCKVEVQDGDVVVGTAEANSRGEWVVVPDQPLEPGSRELGLRSTCGTAEALSDRLVVVVVPERGQDIAGRASDADGGALALSVPRTGDGQTEVLQAPAADADEGTDVAAADESVGVGLTALSLDVVDYNNEGELQVSGQAEAGAQLRVYLDNGLVGEATANDDEEWTLRPSEPVAPGLYTLRVDQVAPNGAVTARVELPFLRGEPLTDLPEGRIVVVQPGNSLWRIARRTYGSGLQFTQIFEANADQIRDPDLIYPGQIFTLPTVN